MILGAPCLARSVRQEGGFQSKHWACGKWCPAFRVSCRGWIVKREVKMAKSTRRTLLRNGCVALGSANLLSSNALELASAQSESASVFHVFAFQWKPGTSEAQKDRAAKEIAAFQGAIPGLLQTHVGPNISPRGKGYTFGGIMQFKNKASLDAYVQHPAHQALLAWLVPLIDAIE